MEQQGRGISAIFLVIGLCHVSWLSRYPTIRDELDLTLSEMSTYVSGQIFGFVVGLAIAGWLVRRLGPAIVLAASTPVMGAALVGALLAIYSSLPAGVVALLCIYGISFSVADVAATVCGTDLERLAGKPRMSRFYAAFSVGSLIALLAGTGAEVVNIAPVPHLLAATFVLVTVSLISLKSIPRARPRRVKHGSPFRMPAINGPRKCRVVNRRVGVLGIIGAGAALAEGGANNWVPLAFVDEYGTTAALGISALAIVVAGTVMIRVFGNALVERWGRVFALRSTLFIGACGVFLVVVSPSTWLALAGVVLWGVGLGLAGPVAFSAAADDPILAAERVSALSVMSYSGFLIGPIVFGYLGDVFGLRVAFIPIIVMLLFGSLLAKAAAKAS